MREDAKGGRNDGKQRVTASKLRTAGGREGEGRRGTKKLLSFPGLAHRGEKKKRK